MDTKNSSETLSKSTSLGEWGTWEGIFFFQTIKRRRCGYILESYLSEAELIEKTHRSRRTTPTRLTTRLKGWLVQRRLGFRPLIYSGNRIVSALFANVRKARGNNSDGDFSFHRLIYQRPKYNICVGIHGFINHFRSGIYLHNRIVEKVIYSKQ